MLTGTIILGVVFSIVITTRINRNRNERTLRCSSEKQLLTLRQQVWKTRAGSGPASTVDAPLHTHILTWKHVSTSRAVS